MGTHISRVKSVDLDAWTDEQAQSMVKWGNRKANKYWEAKLDPGHVPSEGKIDNFVKTKYVSKRWTDNEDRPDPDDLSDDEKDLPAIQTQKSPSASTSAPERATAATRPTAKTAKIQEQPTSSLLGLDFIDSDTKSLPTTNLPPVAPVQGAQQTVPSNVSLLSATSAEPSQRSAAAPRNDLKMSIMSLYASAPKPQQSYSQRQAPQQFNPVANSTTSAPRSASAFDDLNGLFGGMNVAAAAQPSRSQPSIASTFATQRSQLQSSTSRAASAQLGNASSPAQNDEWGTTDDAWGGFQSTQSKATKQPSAFDDLYSTSVSHAELPVVEKADFQ